MVALNSSAAPVSAEDREREVTRCENLANVTRELRRCGVAVDAVDAEANCLVIGTGDEVLLYSHFIGGLSNRRLKLISHGHMARHTVCLRGVDVVWFTAP